MYINKPHIFTYFFVSPYTLKKIISLKKGVIKSKSIIIEFGSLAWTFGVSSNSDNPKAKEKIIFVFNFFTNNKLILK